MSNKNVRLYALTSIPLVGYALYGVLASNEPDCGAIATADEVAKVLALGSANAYETRAEALEVSTEDYGQCIAHYEATRCDLGYTEQTLAPLIADSRAHPEGLEAFAAEVRAEASDEDLARMSICLSFAYRDATAELEKACAEDVNGAGCSLDAKLSAGYLRNLADALGS